MKASATSPQRRADSADWLETESSTLDGRASLSFGLESPLPAPNSSLVTAEATPTELQAGSANKSCVDTLSTHAIMTRRNCVSRRANTRGEMDTIVYESVRDL